VNVSDIHLAQINVARLVAPIDAPEITEFVAALDPVNARADQAPGFVWRLQTEEGNATAIHAFDDPLVIVNLSVWESLEALEAFVYGDEGHRAVLRRRREWFERPAEAPTALWWIPAGTIPTVAEAATRLEHLRAHGPTAEAFTFRDRFSAG
jgi:heme-degrading monooxygenase HmoA